MAGFEGNNDNDLMRLESQDTEIVDSNSNDQLLAQKGLHTTTVHKCLNDPEIEKAVDDYNALSTEEKHIFDLKVDKIIRNYHKKKGEQGQPVNLFFALQSNNPNHYDFQAYLAQITKKLEDEGLWLEEPKEKLESEIFLPSEEKDIDLDRNLNPKSLTQIYTKKNGGVPLKQIFEPKDHGLEWKESEDFEIFDWPKMTEPVSHNLLRRNPWSIEEKVARLMVDGHFFKEHSDIEKLFPCAYFFSKSIFDRKLFIIAKYKAFENTPYQKRFRSYSFHRYKKDQVILKSIIAELLKSWFLKNNAAVESVNDYVTIENLNKREITQLIKSIWKRFSETFDSLTEKQLEAVEAVYLDVPPMTYSEAAEMLKISRDSFQDRIKGAVKKFKQALPELQFIKSVDEVKTPKTKEIMYNGFFRKSHSEKIHDLFRIEPETNKKTKLPIRKAPSKQKEKVNPTIIRVWAIASTPIPDFAETDYYLGLYPEGYINRRRR
ncbi:MAG: hypothetical protein L6Q37_06365 [Bdellovibrionaceae bacterium]|nr:hypothetical protein [Pseudobdellovibrionaceae bacterium]NUM59949.1 sigma-70 family RNA polymerase sigma factor [Pseudobdellovibrionaceae bacterium]